MTIGCSFRSRILSKFTIARERIACGPDRAAVSSPTSGLLIRTAGRGARINISLHGAALNRQLTELLGAAPTVPLEFLPSMDLTTSYGRSLAQYVRLAVTDFERAGPMRWDAITTSRFEQFIMCRLLLSHPNNHTQVLRDPASDPPPRDLRRAIEYMEANLDAPITIADIAEASRLRDARVPVFPRLPRHLADALPQGCPVRKGPRCAEARPTGRKGLASRKEMGLLAFRPLRSRISEALRGEPFGDALEAPGAHLTRTPAPPPLKDRTTAPSLLRRDTWRSPAPDAAASSPISQTCRRSR